MLTKLEAESAQISFSDGIEISADASASKGLFVNVGVQTGLINWNFNNYYEAGNYEIGFGYRLSYDTPKGQFINVNGIRIRELMFDGPMNKWLEKKTNVDLIQGKNTIQMEMSWGYMQVDYLAVPTIVVSGIEAVDELPHHFSLSQNYPNPFNPVTVIGYSVPQNEHVTLKVYDVLGSEVATLVNDYQRAGTYKIIFNGQRTNNNVQLTSGIYFYKISAGNFSQTRKMIFLK